MKVRVQHAIVIELHAVGTVEFRPEFLKQVDTSLRVIAKKYEAKDVHLDLNGKAIVLEVKGIDLTNAAHFKDAVVQEVQVLAEHGPDSDLLNVLLERHPELRNHPRLPNLVSSFENMSGVLKDILGDKSGPMLAELQRREQEGITLVVEDLAASKRAPGMMSPAERQVFREQCILGQSAEQVKARENLPRKDQADLPEIYKRVAKQKAKVDPEASGDAGNVFTTPTKGSNG